MIAPQAQRSLTTAALLLALLPCATLARAEGDASDSTSVAAAQLEAGVTTSPAPIAAAPLAADGLEYLVPALATHPYRLESGVRPYLHRLAVSPGFGSLGSERLFELRAAYNPNSWLGYEASIGHNPNHAVQAILHRFSVQLRRPLTGRLQPYGSAGYGMVVVLPGRSLNAEAVTRNVLTYGGGLECFIRSDLALRGELLGMTVVGNQRLHAGSVAYQYREATIALAFYRTLRP